MTENAQKDIFTRMKKKDKTEQSVLVKCKNGNKKNSSNVRTDSVLLSSTFSDTPVSDSDFVVISEDSDLSESLSVTSENHHPAAEKCSALVNGIKGNCNEKLNATASKMCNAKKLVTVSGNKLLNVRKNHRKFPCESKSDIYVENLSEVQLHCTTSEKEKRDHLNQLAESETGDSSLDSHVLIITDSEIGDSLLIDSTVDLSSNSSNTDPDEELNLSASLCDIVSAVKEHPRSKEHFISNVLKMRSYLKPTDFNYEQENDLFLLPLEASLFLDSLEFLNSVKDLSPDEIFTYCPSVPNEDQIILCESDEVTTNELNVFSIDCNSSSGEENNPYILLLNSKNFDENLVTVDGINFDDINLELVDFSNKESVNHEFSDGNSLVTSTKICSESEWIDIGIARNIELPFDFDLGAAVECETSSSKSAGNSIKSSGTLNSESSNSKKKETKRKRKRCIWSTGRKRRCKKKKISEVSNKDKQTYLEFDTLREEDLCDTCEEDEDYVAEVDSSHLNAQSTCSTEYRNLQNCVSQVECTNDLEFQDTDSCHNIQSVPMAIDSECNSIAFVTECSMIEPQNSDPDMSDKLDSCDISEKGIFITDKKSCNNVSFENSDLVDSLPEKENINISNKEHNFINSEERSTYNYCDISDTNDELDISLKGKIRKCSNAVRMGTDEESIKELTEGNLQVESPNTANDSDQDVLSNLEPSEIKGLLLQKSLQSKFNSRGNLESKYENCSVLHDVPSVDIEETYPVTKILKNIDINKPHGNETSGHLTLSERNVGTYGSNAHCDNSHFSDEKSNSAKMQTLPAIPLESLTSSTCGQKDNGDIRQSGKVIKSSFPLKQVNQSLPKKTCTSKNNKLNLVKLGKKLKSKKLIQIDTKVTEDLNSPKKDKYKGQKLNSTNSKGNDVNLYNVKAQSAMDDLGRQRKRIVSKKKVSKNQASNQFKVTDRSSEVTLNSKLILQKVSESANVIRKLKRIPKLSERKEIESEFSQHQTVDLENKQATHGKEQMLTGLNTTQSYSFGSPSITLESNKNKGSRDDAEDNILNEILDYEHDFDNQSDIYNSEMSCQINHDEKSEISVTVSREIPDNIKPSADMYNATNKNISANKSRPNFKASNYDYFDEYQNINYSPNKETIQDVDCQKKDSSLKAWLHNENISYDNSVQDIQTQNLPSDEDTDSDGEHSFKRVQREKHLQDEMRKKGAYAKDQVRDRKIHNSLENEDLSHDLEVRKKCGIAIDSSDSLSSSGTVGSMNVHNESIDISYIDQNATLCKSKEEQPLKSFQTTKVMNEHLPSIDDVLLSIKNHCSGGMLIEAVNIAKAYISVSSSSTMKVIYQQLFSNIMDHMNDIDAEVIDVIACNIIDELVNILNDYDLYDSEICSQFIIECISKPDLAVYCEKIFDLCKTKKILLNSDGLSAFSFFLAPDEISKILDFLEYVKYDCHLDVPKDLLHSVLDECMNCINSPYFERTCMFLEDISFEEVDIQNLMKFFDYCMKYEWWSQLSSFFWAGSKKPPIKTFLLHSLLRIFLQNIENADENFSKFAVAVHANVKKLPLQVGIAFSQMGTALMIHAYTKEKLNIAQGILFTLHYYNVNYYDLQMTLLDPYETEFYVKEMEKPFEICSFPFTAAFIAVDICLYFKRPKDAYEIFRCFSWITPNENCETAVKDYILKRRFNYLLKLVQLLNKVDPMERGLQSLCVLLTSAEQDFSEEDLTDFAQDLESVYNDNLIHLLNSKMVQQAKDLLQYSYGTKKNLLNVWPDVLRGLIVTFAQNEMPEEAKKLFIVGYSRNIYCIEKPVVENIPWQLTIMTHWTTCEIKFAIEWFLDKLFPLLMDKQKKTEFEKWFTLKLIFQDSDEIDCIIDCLKESPIRIDCSMKKTIHVLKKMDPNLKYVEYMAEKCLGITSDSFYNFWKSKSSVVSPKVLSLSKSFSVSGRQGISFGRESPNFEKCSVEEISTTNSSDNLVNNTSSLFTCKKKYPTNPSEEENLNKIRSVFSHILPPLPSSTAEVHHLSSDPSDSLVNESEAVPVEDSIGRSVSNDVSHSANVSHQKSLEGLSDKVKKNDTDSLLINSPAKICEGNLFTPRKPGKSFIKLKRPTINSAQKLTPLQKSARKLCIQSKAIVNKSSILKKKKFENFTVSLQGNASTRKIIPQVQPGNTLFLSPFDVQSSSQSKASDSSVCKDTKSSGIQDSGICTEKTTFISSPSKSSPVSKPTSSHEILNTLSCTEENAFHEKRSKSIFSHIKSLNSRRELLNIHNTLSEQTGNNTNPSVNIKLPVAHTNSIISNKQMLKTSTSSTAKVLCQPKASRISMQADNSTNSCISVNKTSYNQVHNLNTIKRNSYETGPDIESCKPKIILLRKKTTSPEQYMQHSPETSTASKKLSNLSSTSPDCSDEEFVKIMQFLKTKILLKHKNLTPSEVHENAVTLAQIFVQETNGVPNFRKAMKSLILFADKNI